MKKTENINGVEYTFQKMPPRQWARLQDRCQNRYGVSLMEKLFSEILEHIVIDPKITLDDFQDWDTVEEVVRAASRFQRGQETNEEQEPL